MEKIDFKNLDNKSKVQIAVTSVLVVALIIILTNSISTILRKRYPVKPASISPGTFKEIVKRDIGMASKMADIQEPYEYRDAIKSQEDGPWGRDPFSEKAALKGSELVVSDLKLEGILWHHGKSPSAIVNGEIVGEGDKIGGTTVVSIGKDSIIVSDGSKNYKLNLW